MTQFMKKLFYILFFISSATFAQRVTIKGSVVDSTAKPLEYATVLILSSKDSSLVSFGRADYRGDFEIKNVSNGTYIFKITYVGYQNFTKAIAVLDNDMDFGKVMMKPISKELAGVTIKGERAPVEFSGDTIKYNAGSFKVQPNAVVEDLLKKLPGVQVEKDGTIKAQGETVRRVTVDGKEFFGRDPKIATQNLPADAVDQVKLFDKRSDQTEFTGIDDGQRSKTIDLKLKDDRKKGVFGTLMGAYGGKNDRFNSRANINKFTKSSQFSVLGMANNINQQGFSISDYLNFTGDMQRMMSGGGGRMSFQFDANDMPLGLGQPNRGFMRSWASGINFNQNKTPKTDVNGSYFFNGLDNVTDREVNRQNFFGNRNFTSLSKSNQQNLNFNHRFNFSIDQKIDSANSIKFTTYATYNKTDSRNMSSSETIGESGKTENTSTRNTNNFGDGINLNSNLLFRHKFNKKGRTFSANATFGLSNNNSEGDLNAVNSFLNLAIPRTERLNQVNNQNREQLNYGVNTSYTEPLGKRRYLEANYNFRKSDFHLNREVYDVAENRRTFNSRLSNKFENDYTYNRGGLNFRVNQKKYNYSFGVSLQHSELDGKLLIQDIPIRRTFTNLLPNVHYNYNFTSSHNVRLDYMTDIQEPNIQDLSPIIDNTDPLNIREGNPNLRPEYMHRGNLQYMLNNLSNFSFFMTMFNVTYTQNRISSSQTIDNSLVRTYKPINVKYGLNLFGDLTYGFRIKPLKANLNLGYRLIHDRSLTLVNNVENTTKQFIHRGEARVDFRLNDKLDLAFNSEISYNDTRYSVNTSINQAFLTNLYGADVNWTLPKKWYFKTDFEYSVYTGRQNGFNQKIPIWNAAISKQFLKNSRGELKLSINDALNRNVGINRTAQANFIQDERITSLGRYYLITFTYNLRAMNASQGGGSNMRVIMR